MKITYKRPILEKYEVWTAIGLGVALGLILGLGSGCGTVDNVKDLTVEEILDGKLGKIGDPDKEEPMEGEPDKFTTAVFHTCPKEVASYKVVHAVPVIISGGKIHYKPTHPEEWQYKVEYDIIGEQFIMLYRNGAWHTGPSDGIHKMPSTKEMSSACVPDGDTRTYLPRSGEDVGFVVGPCSRNGRHMKPKQRSAIFWTVWP